MLTTSKAEEDIVRTYDLGVNSYVTKPVTFKSLVELVKVLGRYWFEVVELPPGRKLNAMYDRPPVKVLLVDDDEDDFVITRDLISRIREPPVPARMGQQLRDRAGGRPAPRT